MKNQTSQSALAARSIDTPAFVYDEGALLGNLLSIKESAEASGARLLLSVKPLPLAPALAVLAPHVEGFAASSLFEATLARGVLGGDGTIHLTTPGFRPDEIGAIGGVCDYVSLNSLSQWERYAGELGRSASCGLRVNPQLSLVADARYDPCRRASKLGVPLDELAQALDEGLQLEGISGLHFHTNCASKDFAGLLATVRRLEAHLGPLLGRVAWINLGGGYLFDEANDLGPFREAVALARSTYGLEVFIEPGAAVMRKAGYLVSTVLDAFTSDGKTVAVLDTTVNHMPEVFEYQFAPDVLGHSPDGRYRYVLAGCTCLAGDVFGEYAFDQPLEVGSRVIIANAGAYTLVKANMFNGVNLPTVYALRGAGEPVLMKRYSYGDFADRWEVAPDLPLRERA